MVFGLPSAGQAPSPTPPSAVETTDAFRLIEPWVRSLEVPADAVGPNVGGASVTLRLRGRVVGRGVAIGLGPRTLPDATRLAIDEASDDLAPVNDLDAAERAELEAASLTIALELAGAPVPIDEATYTEISAAISPGMEAVAVGLGRQADAVFPLEMLFTGQQAGGAASRLVSELTGDAMMGGRQPGGLVADAGASFFRLRTTAVAQVKPDEPPRVLYRGGRLVELRDVASRAALEQFADELAAWLARQGGVGTYMPTNATVLEAPTEATAALRVFALSRAIDRLDEAVAATVREQVGAMEPGHPIAGALVDLARHELGLEPRFVTTIADDVPRVTRAINAYALARVGDHASAGEVVADLRRVDNASQLVGVMPWLGWAEIEFAGDGDIPSAIALRQMREIVTGFQLTLSDAGADNLDLVGGVVFTSGTVPLPTWQTARPIAFLATMLGDERLTEPGEVDAELVNVLHSIRFLRQLSASEVEGFMYREPAEAVGGVRAATWDQRMPIDATAMALLVVVETLESIDRLALRQAEQDAGEAAEQP
ncbi:MAG: hypothetical protein AAFQ31_08460 [Planctomycetota bacterium]